MDLQLPGGLVAGWTNPLLCPNWGSSMERKWGSLSFEGLGTGVNCVPFPSVECSDARPCLGNKLLSIKRYSQILSNGGEKLSTIILFWYSTPQKNITHLNLKKIIFKIVSNQFSTFDYPLPSIVCLKRINSNWVWHIVKDMQVLRSPPEFCLFSMAEWYNSRHHRSKKLSNN